MPLSGNYFGKSVILKLFPELKVLHGSQPIKRVQIDAPADGPVTLIVETICTGVNLQELSKLETITHYYRLEKIDEMKSS